MPSPTSFVNQRLPGSAPIDAASAAYVANLIAQTEAATPTFEIRNFSYTTWWAGPNTPRQKVWLDAEDGTSALLREMLEQIPIPPEFRPPGPFPGDNAAAIYMPSTDEFFELHGLRFKGVDTMRTAEEVPGCSTLDEAGWHCNNAAAAKEFSKSPGYWSDGDWPGATLWGISGSRIFAFPLVIKIAEAQRGYIPHPIRIEAIHTGISETQFRWPAQKCDGGSKESTALQEGMIFTVPASFDPSGTFSDAFLQTVATATRDFGLILTDGAGGVSIKCQREDTIANSQSFATDAWLGPEGKPGGVGAILKKSATTLAKEFWAGIGPHLQVVDASYRPSTIAPGVML